MPLSKTTWLAAQMSLHETLLCHVERVGGVARVAAWVETPAGNGDLAGSLAAAMQELAAFTGSQYLDEKGAPLRINAQGAGCDTCAGTQCRCGLAVCLASLPPLRILVAGLTEALSIEAARQAVRQAPAQEIGLLTPDTAANARQVAELLAHSSPDIVLLVGGSDGGAAQPVEALARLLLVGLGRLPEAGRPGLFYAGNQAAIAGIERLIPERLDVRWLANVLPARHDSTPRPEPVLQALQAAQQARLERLAGYQTLREWAHLPDLPWVEEVAQRLLRFWSRHHRLQAVAGGWWLDDRLMVLRTSDGGRTFECNWNAVAAGSVQDSWLPRPLLERAARSAVWSEVHDHWRSPGWRPERRSRRSARGAQLGLWLDEDGLSLALAALASHDSVIAAQVLSLDALQAVE